MQVLYEGTCSAGELASRTGFQGGGLYHHLRELRYARCISESKGRYSLTPLGRQLLVTMIMMARNVIKDRGEEGLAAGANWD
jgi:predicted transcriptional regulator